MKSSDDDLDLVADEHMGISSSSGLSASAAASMRLGVSLENAPDDLEYYHDDDNH
jgi:hypothetical protein